jgi:hypothetical protein
MSLSESHFAQGFGRVVLYESCCSVPYPRHEGQEDMLLAMAKRVLDTQIQSDLNFVLIKSMFCITAKACYPPMSRLCKWLADSMLARVWA